ncbi:MAG TPA: tetratricopeptide repeat protein [Syntrophorhabdaceae bacterium]|nr:tetratricopeptide repeat protein [Syntrophorhabdaceae bacterium]
MSIILDALKKAQQQRKKPAPEVPFSLPGPKKKPRMLVYGILLVCVLAVLGYLFIPAFHKPRQFAVPAAPPVPPKQQAAKVEAAPQKPVPVKEAPKQEEVSVAKQEHVKKITAKTMPVRMAAAAQPARKIQAPARRTGEAKEDEAAVTKATNSEKVDILYNEAQAALQAGRTGEAKRIYLSILAVKPDHVEALNNLGVIAIQEGNSKGALYYFKKILEFQKAYPKAYNNIGLLMMGEGDKGLAEEYFRKAIVMEPDSIEPYLNLSALLRSDGRLDEAARLLETPIQKKVKNPALFLSYALIQDAAGKTEDAVRYYRRYLSAVKSSEARREVIERLRLLEENRNPERR